MPTTVFSPLLQDILNVIFHHFPSDLHLLSCRCNFRPDQCLSLNDSCPDLDSNVDAPPLMLHGNRAACQDGWPFGSLPAYLYKTAWNGFHKDRCNYNVVKFLYPRCKKLTT